VATNTREPGTENLAARYACADWARDRFAEVLGQVHYAKDTIIVGKQGEPMVAAILKAAR
jgi:hypothetical protein